MMVTIVLITFDEKDTFSKFSITLTQMLLLSFLYRFCDATKTVETKESSYVTGDFSFYSSLND